MVQTLRVRVGFLILEVSHHVGTSTAPAKGVKDTEMENIMESTSKDQGSNKRSKP